MQAIDIQEISVCQVDDSTYYFKAFCLALMKRQRYQVYVCLGSDDNKLFIAYGYCQCPIGMGQACSYIGGLLFALSKANRTEAQVTASTSNLCKWDIPRQNRIGNMDSPLSEVPATPILMRHISFGGEFSPSDAVVPECPAKATKDRYSLDAVPGTPVTPFRAPKSRTPSIRDRRQLPQDQQYSITPDRLARSTIDSPYIPSPSDSLVPTTPKSRLNHRTRRGRLPRFCSPVQVESPGISKPRSCSKLLHDISEEDNRCPSKGHVPNKQLRSIYSDKSENRNKGYSFGDGDGEGIDKAATTRIKTRSSNLRRSPRLFHDSSDQNQSPDFLDLI